VPDRIVGDAGLGQQPPIMREVLVVDEAIHSDLQISCAQAALSVGWCRAAYRLDPSPNRHRIGGDRRQMDAAFLRTRRGQLVDHKSLRSLALVAIKGH
jgi:hypothetical protein